MNSNRPPSVQQYRPTTKPSPPPQNKISYNSAARRVTLAIVALPIAIVTSYVLFQRVVLGEERKVLRREPIPSPIEPLHKDKEDRPRT